MAGEQIGVVSKIQDFREDEALVAFELPYGESKYSIAFNNDELDKVFEAGVERILGNRSLKGFGFQIELEGGDLPLFVGARAINMETSKPGGFVDADMSVALVSQSVISQNEHRGLLSVQREAVLGSWRLTDYETAAPIPD